MIVLATEPATPPQNKCFRAFVDDFGAVLANWEHDSIVPEQLLQEIADMSGLESNVEDTICILLWEEGREDIEQTLVRSRRQWSNIV